MKTILALDVSSATIGWCLMQYHPISILKYGHIKPLSKKKSNGLIYKRLDSAYELIKMMVREGKPDCLVIEDYAKRFSKGRSSANTIIILATFNESCSLAAYRELGLDSYRLDVKSARTIVSNEYNISIEDKDDVLHFINEQFVEFQIVLNRNNNVKKECYDEADAVFIGFAYCLGEK